MAVRAAIGASRARLVRQLLMESVLLALAGGALGVLLAEGGLSALLALAPDTLPRTGEIAVDGRALAFTLALALLTGVGFGALPAFQASGVRLHDSLKEGGRGATDGGRGRRLRSALVVGEVAIALVLLAGAGLLMRSFSRLQQVSPGFRPEGVVAAQVALPRPKYLNDAQYVAFANRTMSLLAQLPGVQALAVAHSVPFTGHATVRPFAVAGRPEPANLPRPLARRDSVSPEFFRVLGVPLLRGRTFEARDHVRPRAVIVNELVARRFFPGEDPVGKRISIMEGPQGEREIVGVVGDLKLESLQDDSVPEIYQPFAVAPDNDMLFILRTAAPVPGLPAAIRAAVSSVDPEQPVASIRALSSWVEASLARQRFAATLFAVFAGVALLLAAMGIYAVMAYAVARRTGEIGVRMALGAQAGDVLGLVLRQGGLLVGLGLGAGVAGALLLTRLIEKLLFGVTAHDPPTLLAVVVTLALVAAAACLVPARRAMRVDPMRALRSE
jgi:putative ABC transport system permease protein